MADVVKKDGSFKNKSYFELSVETALWHFTTFKYSTKHLRCNKRVSEKKNTGYDMYIL